MSHYYRLHEAKYVKYLRTIQAHLKTDTPIS